MKSPNLYVALAKLMGLKAVSRIDGYVKPPHHIPSDFLDKKYSWNAVRIGKKWILLDCTAGAGRVAGMGNNTRFIKDFKSHFFRIDPEHWILSHFPKARDAQLLKRPVSIREFASSAYVDPKLLRLGVSAKKLRKAAKENQRLVKVIGFLGDSTKIIDVPLKKWLEKGREYRFVIRSRDYSQIVIKTGDEKLLSLKKVGDRFDGKFTVPKGKLHVGGMSTKTNTLEPFLEYVVQ